MSTFLYMFWDGFSGDETGATLVGQWFAPILTHGNQDRIAASGNQDRISTYGNQDRVGT